MTTIPAVSKTMMYGRLKVNTKTGTIKNETTDCLMVFWNKQCLFKISDDNELLKLAGKEVQQKWTCHKSKGYFKHSVILETSGGKLNCSKIIHVPYDITTIDAAVKAGLMKADSNQMKTVVIPIPHKDSATTDVITSYKGMLAALKELSKSLKVVLSVTFILEGQIDSTLFNEVFGKKSKIHGNGKVSEAIKRSVDPPKSTPVEPMVQTLSPNQTGHDPMPHLQLKIEANKRPCDHHINKKNTVDPSRSIPTKPVQKVSPDQPGPDLKTRIQSEREAKKRSHHHFSREDLLDPPRSTSGEPMVQQISPDQPGHDTKTHLHLWKEDKKRFHHHIDRENSMDPPGSIPREPMMKHISLDQLDHDTETHRSRTEANERSHHHVSKESSVDPAASTPTAIMVPEIFPKQSSHDPMTQLQLKREGNKRSQHDFNRENSVDLPRSAPRQQMEEKSVPNQPGRDTNTHTESRTEDKKRFHHHIDRENSMDPPGSIPREPMMKHISLDQLDHDTETHRSRTEANERSHHHVSKESSVDPAASTPTAIMVPEIFPKQSSHDPMTQLQLKREGNKRSQHDFNRENSVDLPRSAPRQQMEEKSVPNQPGRDTNTHTESRTEDKKRFHHHIDRENSMDPPGSIPREPMMKHISLDQLDHDTETHRSRTEANERSHHHVSKESSVDPAASTPTAIMVPEIFPKQSSHDPMTQLQLKREGNKRSQHDFNRENSVDLPRSAPRQQMEEKSVPNQPGRDTNTHTESRTEDKKRFHHHIDRENSMDPPGSIPREPMMKHISLDQLDHDTETHRSRTEANERSHHHVSKESSVDPAASTPTAIMVPEIFPKQSSHDPMTQLQLKREGNKRSQHDFNRENSVDLPRSAPRQQMEEKSVPNQPGRDTNTHTESRTEDKKRFHHHIDRENSMDPPGSIPREPMMKHISLDQLDHDTETHRSRTEANERSHHHVSKESSVDPAASTPTAIMVPEIFPKQSSHDPMTQLQLKREGNKRSQHDFNRENSVDLPRSAPRQQMEEKSVPNQPGRDTNTHTESRTEDKKRFHHHIDRENSMDPPGSIPREPMMKHISLDQLDHDTETHRSRTEANERSHHHVSKESSVDPAASTPTAIMVPEIFPKQSSHDPMTQLQLKREGNKRSQHDFNRENSVDLPRSAPRQQMEEKSVPNQPGRDTNTHTESRTEDKKRFHHHIDRENSMDPPGSIPREPMMKHISLDQLDHDTETHQSRTDVKRVEHTKPCQVEPLQPQELDFPDPDSLVERANYTGQKKPLITILKEISGVEVNIEENRGATTHQMNIVKDYLESSTPDEKPCVHSDLLSNVSELEFKALQIFENGFEKMEGVHISWDRGSVVICGSPTLVLCVKKNLTKRMGALKKKQSDEVFLDEKEKKFVRSIIEEMQSEDIVCVYDETTSKVVVYSDKQDDIRKFKHKLKLRTGKVKETGRCRERFAENAQLLEECQEGSTLSFKSMDLQRDFSGTNNASDAEIFYTKENIKVAVYMANILNLPVDCIVNAANDKMQHGGGVAKVIAEAAGLELIREGKATVREKMNQKIPVGCQVTTTAGRLPYKCVIHTVGPCWADYEPHNLQKVKDCEKDLYRAIYGCFLEAEKNDVSSVALPAVSSGIYAVPQDMCAVQYAKAVLDYSQKTGQGPALKEIHFIDKLPHLVKLMQDTFRIMIKNGKVPNYNIQNYVASSSHYQLEQSKDTGRKEHRKKDIPADNSQYETLKLKELSPFYYESKVHHTKQFVFQVSSKPVVCIYKGDILKIKNMDAIVCPDDAKGSGIGTIAINLGTKAKYREQKVKRFERQKPNLGDVVITNGEENSFNMIVHVVIKNNFSQKPEFMSTMKKSIGNILRKTNERGNVKTIAIPLFGVKPELLTEKSWAELFLERFVAFCCEVKNPNLEEVHIITHFASRTAYSTVKKVFIDFADKVNKTQLQEKEPPPRPLPPKDSRTSDHEQDTQSGRRHDSKNGDDNIDDNCPICMCPKTDPKAISCGHSFCSECIDEMFKHKPVCPICGKIVGTLIGDQPKDGTMDVKPSRSSLAGYEEHGSIVITYDFPAGRQGPNHPSPGDWYSHMTRTAYLPNTPEGKKVCKMLKLAFDRRLVFTISQSRTTGKEGLTWNDIHHKTNPTPGAQFGYPDPEYLSRVKDELAAKGITEADLPK